MIEVPVQQMAVDVSDVALPTHIIKRDGREVGFDAARIRRAMERCFQAIGRHYHEDIDVLLLRVVNILSAEPEPHTVEHIQDVVEMVLLGDGEFEAAKAYILYRAEHTRLRKEHPIPTEIVQAFADAKQYFPTPLQEFQYFDKYARFDNDKGRRETWPETVDRSVDFLVELVASHVKGSLPGVDFWERIRSGILNMEAMPSMRLIAMAGPAARRNNLAIYNCSFLAVDSIDAFIETLLLSMAGCGVGFSVERQHISKLPRVEYQQTDQVPLSWQVEDSTEGWGEALRAGLSSWFNGFDVDFDYSLVRPAGTPLKIKGGRASGPDPLRTTLAFARERILARQGSFLRPLDAHDIMCSIGNAAVSGGVRRTALISLFDLDDMEMANCKVGDFETHNSQRWNANNSAVIPDTGISQTQFLKLWNAMVESERGEPGFISRQAMHTTLPERRAWSEAMGTNPCAEVILRPQELCNLSICVARHDDTFQSLADKVELATIIGTIQSLATNFPGMRPEWSKNCQEERLLGVDITGQRDCPVLQDPLVLDMLKQLAINTNLIWARRFGINQSSSVTVVKPSGNSSVLLNCSSGLHGRWAPFYERNVRVAATSPIYQVLKDAGVPLQPENGQETMAQPYTFVASFIVKSPDGTPTRNDLSALDQANYWLHVKKHWTEHNPSITVTYRPTEIMPLMCWVWENIELLGGMSFLPHSDIALAKLPYIQITQTEYEQRLSDFPSIDWSRLFRYEHSDQTEAAQTMACVAGQCDQ